MSVLDYPRIHFNGQFSTNVDTANNDDVGWLTSDPVSVRLTEEFARMSDEQLRTWLQELTPNGTYVNSGWNYFGDHTVQFQQSFVCGVTSGPNESDDTDGLMGKPVQLLGDAGTPPVMVDVDPTGIFGTQIFSGGFQIGDSKLGLACQRDVVCYSRWMGARNTNIGTMGFTGAAATWQIGLTNEHLVFSGKGQSPILSQLAEAAAAGQGVLVQFCCYLLKPGIDAVTLVQDYFQKGIKQQNPAVGYLVGTIGVWNENEWATAPNGRRLNPQPANVPIGSAAAALHADRKLVSLNLITAIPEDGGQTPAEAPADPGTSVDRITFALEVAPPKKVKLGVVDLKVRPAGGGEPVTIGQVEGYSDYELYFRTGGIIDVPYEDGDLTPLIESGDLLMVSETANEGKPLLEEAPIVVDTDDRAVYLDVGDSESQRKTITVGVRERGQMPSGPVSLELSLGVSNRNNFAPLSLDYPHEVTVEPDGNGTAKIELSAINASEMVLIFQPKGVPASSGFDPATSPFTNVRVFPADDYSDVPEAKRLSWDFVYEEALRFYWVLFPAMVEMIDLSDEETVVGNAEVIIDRLSGVPWLSPQFMPVTRSMSAGRRKLLEDFLRFKMPAGGDG